MMLGAVVELITIGAVLPFLALLADPHRGADLPGFGLFAAVFGGDTQGSLLLRATILLVVAIMLAAVSRLLILRLTQRFVFMLGHDVGIEIFKRMLRQPYKDHVGRNSSEFLAGIDKVQTLIVSVLLPLMNGLVAAVIAMAIILLLTLLAPGAAAAAAAAVTLIYLVVTFATRDRLRSNSALIAETATARMKAVQEGFGGLRDILLDQSQEVFEARFRDLDRAYRRAQASNAFVSAAPRYAVEAAGIVVFGLVAVQMSGQPGGIVAAIPVLGAFALGAQRLLPLVQTAYLGWSQLSGHRAIVRDLVALMQAPVVPTLRVVEPVPFEREIAFDRVSLRYPGGDYAIRDVTLRISKGERLGVVGRTGSGKSSFLDLFMGLLEPTAGEIRIDGHRLHGQRCANWQAQIAHVPQSIYLADASISANIAFGRPGAEIDMERVRDAARQAQLEEFIAESPLGFATVVGDRGVRLSGGQRQRIAIARAFYKEANVLILDEATAQLDRTTEASLVEAVAAIGRHITILVVAHRDSALVGCDRIIRFEAGRLVDG